MSSTPAAFVPADSTTITPQQNPSQLHSYQHGATQDQTQSRAGPRSLVSTPPCPPQRFILSGDLEYGLNHTLIEGKPHVPFQPITNKASTTVTGRATSFCTNSDNIYLAINKQKTQRKISGTPISKQCLYPGTEAGEQGILGEEVLAKYKVASGHETNAVSTTIGDHTGQCL